MSAQQGYRFVARRAIRQPMVHARTRIGYRFASTEGSAPAKADSSHLAAGLAGGAVVLGGIYGYYHYSGTAAVVNSTKSALHSAQSAKDQIFSKAPSADDAIGLLKSLVKPYASVVPGGTHAVDATFAHLESLAKEHGPAVQETLTKTFNDIQSAVKEGKDGSDKIMKALMEATTRLQNMAGEKGGQVWKNLVDKYPEAGKVLEGEGVELSKLTEKYGPEAQKIATDAYQQSYDLIQNGGLNGETYEKIRALLTQKSKEITSLAQRSSTEAWEVSAKKAGPLLEKLPDLNKMVEEQIGSLTGIVGEENVKLVQGMYDELNRISSDKSKSATEKATAAQKVVEAKLGTLNQLKSKAKSMSDDAKNQASSYLGSDGSGFGKVLAGVPGMGELSRILGGEDLKHLKELAEKHGADAEKILESTYDEMKDVLKKKLQEAKKVGGNAADDAKKEVKK